MAVIKVTVEGVAPGVLMSSPAAMLEEPDQGTVAGPKKKKLSRNEAAAQAAYFLNGKDGALGFPCVAFHRSTMDGGKNQTVKIGGTGRPRSVQSVLAGVWEVEPKDLIPLTRNGKPIKSYEVDIRTGLNKAMHPPARIVLARPLVVAPWQATFDILWDDVGADENTPELIKQCMERAGRQVGVGAFRPLIQGKATGGWFGRFAVIEWAPA